MKQEPVPVFVLKTLKAIEVRKVDNRYLPDRIVEYLHRDVSEQDFVESMGINHEAQEILKTEREKVLQQLERDRQNAKLLLEMAEVERQMGSLFYHIGGMEFVISEGHFNIAVNCMKDVMALDYTSEHEAEYAQILMEYGTVLVTLMEQSAIPHSVISPSETDAAAVVREAVDIYRKNQNYQDKESVQRYRDALQLFGEACYLSLLLREQADV